jgi:hypothetical protein
VIRRVLLVVSLAVLGLVMFRQRETPPVVAVQRETRPPVTLQPMVETSARPVRPTRNVFEYVAPAPMLARPSVPVTRPVPVMTLPAVRATPSPVRLVGILRRGAGLRAALSIRGEVYVLAPGEGAGGYTVIGIDEDIGVRLRTPEGDEESLAP